MSQLETAKRDIANARDLVDHFRAAVAAGGEVDYDKFNAVIETACSKAVSLPFEQVAEIRTDLADLLEQLNLAKIELHDAETSEDTSPTEEPAG